MWALPTVPGQTPLDCPWRGKSAQIGLFYLPQKSWNYVCGQQPRSCFKQGKQFNNLMVLTSTWHRVKEKEMPLFKRRFKRVSLKSILICKLACVRGLGCLEGTVFLWKFSRWCSQHCLPRGGTSGEIQGREKMRGFHSDRLTVFGAGERVLDRGANACLATYLVLRRICTKISTHIVHVPWLMQCVCSFTWPENHLFFPPEPMDKILIPDFQCMAEYCT